jgi:hypothetical protein
LLGGVTGGLGNVLGGVTSPLLNPLVGGLLGTNGKPEKPAKPAPPQIVVLPPSSPWGAGYSPGLGGGRPGWAGGASPYAGGVSPYAGGVSPFAGGVSPYGGGSPPFAPRPESPEAIGTVSPSKEQSVTIRGINTPCRQYPDDYSPDPSKSIYLSSPAKIDAVCWASTTAGTSRQGRGNDDGWLMTKSNCFIKVSEVQEYRNYRKILQPCTEMRHWIGTLMEQYSRKDCYYCPSTSTCGSEDLGSPPYVDLLCYTEGDVVAGNNTWFKNRGKECYFPMGIFDPNGFLGTPGGRC